MNGGNLAASSLARRNKVSKATATREDEAAATTKGHVQRTRRRVPREVRIPQIARIAEDLFGQFGYQGTSMDDVARLAGISKPVVYDLVGSKEELFRLCMARSADELATRVASAVAGCPRGRSAPGGSTRLLPVRRRASAGMAGPARLGQLALDCGDVRDPETPGQPGRRASVRRGARWGAGRLPLANFP